MRLPPPMLVPRAEVAEASVASGSAPGAPLSPVPLTTVAETTTPAPAAGLTPADPGFSPDELAGLLFEPLLRRLRAELLADRGRHGRVTDLRR